MKKSTGVFQLVVLMALLVVSAAFVPSRAEAYTYQTRDWQVVGKKCTAGRWNCRDIYGWRINTRYVPDTQVTKQGMSSGNPASALSAADSTGSTVTCQRIGSKCVTSPVTTLVKTKVPTLDGGTINNGIKPLLAAVPVLPRH